MLLYCRLAFGYVNALNISEYWSKIDLKHPSECGVDYYRTSRLATLYYMYTVAITNAVSMHLHT